MSGRPRRSRLSPNHNLSKSEEFGRFAFYSTRPYSASPILSV